MFVFLADLREVYPFALRSLQNKLSEIGLSPLHVDAVDQDHLEP